MKRRVQKTVTRFCAAETWTPAWTLAIHMPRVVTRIA
jgi:hypothetical protein